MLAAEVRVKKIQFEKQEVVLMKPSNDGASTMVIAVDFFSGAEPYTRVLEPVKIEAICGTEDLPPFTPEQIAEFRETMKNADLSSVEWVPCEK